MATSPDVHGTVKVLEALLAATLFPAAALRTASDDAHANAGSWSLRRTSVIRSRVAMQLLQHGPRGLVYDRKLIGDMLLGPVKLLTQPACPSPPRPLWNRQSPRPLLQPSRLSAFDLLQDWVPCS